MTYIFVATDAPTSRVRSMRAVFALAREVLKKDYNSQPRQSSRENTVTKIEKSFHHRYFSFFNRPLRQCTQTYTHTGLVLYTVLYTFTLVCISILVGCARALHPPAYTHGWKHTCIGTIRVYARVAHRVQRMEGGQDIGISLSLSLSLSVDR